MKYRIDVCFEGYTTLEVEAENEDKAYDLVGDKFREEWFDKPIAHLSNKSTEYTILGEE